MPRGIVYQITNERGDVVMEGIALDYYTKIYPQEYDSSLLEEYPEIPYEVELRNFQVKGLTLETKHFHVNFKDV